MRHGRSAVFICSLLLLLQGRDVYAQLTTADSILMQERCSETLYMLPSLYPGQWYLHPGISAPSDIDSFLLTHFLFAGSEFGSAYGQMTVSDQLFVDTALNPTFNQYYTLYGNAYRQLNPLVQLDFQLNGKQASAYSTFSPTLSPAEREIAFLVIPGSNPNQTTELMTGGGYHNTNCYIKNTLQNYGDVFVLCKPLEDYRALRWHEKKLNSGDYLTPGKNYIYRYLDSVDRPYGVNYLIEAIALVRYLKSHYKKVMLLGCSQGGYATLLLSLNTNPDAALVASGYSKYIDEDSMFRYQLMQNFKQLPVQYDSTLVRSKLAQSATAYLFAWPDNDSYWYQLEHDQHPTSTFFGNLINCSFFFDYTAHSFPTCYTIDTFVQKTINAPKLFFTLTDSLPNGHRIANISFGGHGPFSFTVFHNNKPYQRVDWVSSSFDIMLTEKGQYYLDHVTNLDGEKGYCFDTLRIMRHQALTTEGASMSQSLTQNGPVEAAPVSNILSDLADWNGAEAHIYNLAGEEVASNTIRDGKLAFDLSNRPAGVYTVHLQLRKQVKTFKLCKRE